MSTDRIIQLMFVLKTVFIHLGSCVDDGCSSATVNRTQPPNIILFLADDTGWGDFSSYGHPTQELGPIDQMALEGIRFTQWYAVASLCTPSRTALLTGVLYFSMSNSKWD